MVGDRVTARAANLRHDRVGDGLVADRGRRARRRRRTRPPERPARASSRECARPIPRPPPVTTATRPFRRLVISGLSSSRRTELLYAVRQDRSCASGSIAQTLPASEEGGDSAGRLHAVHRDRAHRRLDLLARGAWARPHVQDLGRLQLRPRRHRRGGRVHVRLPLAARRACRGGSPRGSASSRRATDGWLLFKLLTGRSRVGGYRVPGRRHGRPRTGHQRRALPCGPPDGATTSRSSSSRLSSRPARSRCST